MARRWYNDLMTNKDAPTGSYNSIPEDGSQSAPLSERGLLFLVMGLVLILDQASKYLIESRLPLNHSWEPFPAIAAIFRITHVSNTGAAFGLFSAGSNVFMIVAVIVSIAIILYNRQLPANHYWYRIALGLQLGGALGNFIDRVRIDHVTDFLDFGPWPIFNVADLSIVLGVFLLGFLMLKEQQQEASESQGDAVGELVPGEDRADSA